MSAKKIVTRYLHENSDEYSGLWPIPAGDAPDDEWRKFQSREVNFSNQLYEVKFDLEVDMETGESKIVRVDGRELGE